MEQLTAAFQSRSGFSLRCDSVLRELAQAGLDIVSIPFWVFSPLRRPWRWSHDAVHHVSIPFWVFSPLRPDRRLGQRQLDAVSIPFWVFSPLRHTVLNVADANFCGFNPVLGFLSAATFTSSRSVECLIMFQSRSGFSLRCDRERRTGLARWRRVSIPFWVFSPLRPPVWFVAESPSCAFQSRSGFSLRCDATRRRGPRGRPRGFNPVLGFLSAATFTNISESMESVCFNPVLGFLSAATRHRYCGRRMARVSIPFWVFSPLRPHLRWFLLLQQSFNPVLGFLSAATAQVR